MKGGFIVSIFTPSRLKIVEEVIELGRDHRETYEKYSPNSSHISEFLEMRESEEYKLISNKFNKLVEYLEELDYEDVQFLQTIMYIGRDGLVEGNVSAEQLYTEKFNSLPWNTKEIEISMITEKLPLDNYLNNGKEIIKKLS